MQSIQLSDMRAQFSPITLQCNGRSFVLNITLAKADVGGVSGWVTISGMPPEGSMTVPLKNGKIQWDKKLQKMVFKAGCSGSDRLFGESFKIKFAGTREGDTLQLLCSYELKLKVPVKVKCKGQITASGNLINPGTKARIDNLNFVPDPKDKKGEKFYSNFNMTYPWEQISGTVKEKRKSKRMKDRNTYVSREYSFKFNPSKAGSLSLKMGNALPNAQPPLPIVSSKIKAYKPSMTYDSKRQEFSINIEYLRQGTGGKSP